MPHRPTDQPAPTPAPTRGRPWLVVVAAPKEARAVLEALGVDAPPPEPWTPLRAGSLALVVRSGVGKSAAAGATARCFDPKEHAGVLCVGIAGALPRGPGLCDAVLATPSLFGDEGVFTPNGYLTLDHLGFSDDISETHPDQGVVDAWRGLIDRAGPIATVSSCSGTDAAAASLVTRTGAVVEAMEGAACALAARRIDPYARFAELRVISNTTGDRDRQRWDLDGALARLGDIVPEALERLRDR